MQSRPSDARPGFSALLALGLFTLLACPAAWSQPFCVTPPSGQVGWWRAEGNANDSVGGMLGYLSNGVSYAQSKVGSGFNLDGVNDYVVVPSSQSLKFTGPFTVECWVNADSFPPPPPNGNASRSVFVAKGVDAETSVDWGFGIGPTLKLRPFVQVGASWVYFDCATTLATGAWYHVAMVYDGASLRGYVNGALDGSVAASGVVQATDEPMRIGAYAPINGTASKSLFAGRLDEISLYNRALSSNEVQTVYAAGTAGKCTSTSPTCVAPPSGQVGWWRAEGNASDAVGGMLGYLSNGVSFAQSKVGNGFSFDGVNDYVEVPSSANLKFTGPFSVEAWVNADSFPPPPANGNASRSVFVAKGVDAETSVDWGFGIGPTLKLRPFVQVGGNWVYFDCATTLVTGAWYHVAMVYDGANLRGYVNGTLDGSLAASGVVQATDEPMKIGVYAPINGTVSKSFFAGRLDEISLYNRALSSNEVQAIYVAGSAGKCASAPIACVTPPSGQVGWWRAEGNASDAAGGNLGYLSNGVSFVQSKVGSGFSFDGVNDYVLVPSSANLKFTGPFSVECWVNADSFPPQNGNSSRNAFVAKGVDAESTWDWGFGVGPTLKLRPLAQIGASWAYFDCATTLATGAWYHVAMVYDGASLRGYVNGALDGSGAISGAIQATDHPMKIGAYAPINGTASKGHFAGRLDEISLYNRALSPNEVQVIYAAGSAGKCVSAAPPAITQQPTNQTVVAGNAAQFAVIATGTQPLSYQWKLGANALSSATNATLTILNAQLANAGIYSVVVTNLHGSTISSNAVLTVSSITACVTPPSGQVGWWRAEGNASDAVGGSLGYLSNGVSFAQSKVGSGFSFDGVNDYVVVPSSANLKFTGPFSVECWVNADSFPPQNGNASRSAFVAKGVDAESSVDWGFGVGPTLKLRPFAQIGASWAYFDCATTLATGAWYHVAMVYDGASLRGYVNGALDGSGAISGAIQATDHPMKIGAYAPINGTASKSLFAGRLDEVSLYNRALSSNEIQSIYVAGSAGKCASTPITCVTPPSGQVSWWRAEGNANDSQGTNGGPLQGSVAYTNGLVGQAFRFDGINDGISATSVSGLSAGKAPHTIEAWVNVQALSSGRSWMLVLGAAGSGAHHWILESDGSTHLGVWDGTQLTPKLAVGAWTHLAITYDGTTMSCYTNGQLHSAQAASFNLGTGPLLMRVGMSYYGDPLFKGLLDEVSIYSRALSSSEIQAIYAAGADGKCTGAVPPTNGLVAYYPFSSDANDASGNGNHGAISNATLAADRFGFANSAFNFNGTSGQITISDNAALRGLSSNYTFNVWANFASVPGHDSCILIKSAGGGGQKKWILWKHVEAAPIGIGFLTTQSSGSVGQWNYNFPFSTNRWYMITFSASGTNSLIAVDGVVVSAQPGNTVLPDTTGVTLSIGGAETGGNQWFNGWLDDIRIYNRGLSSNEVQQLYASESSPPGPAPVPPGILTQPMNVTARPGETASFAVAANGTGPLAFQWQRNGTNLANGARITGVTNAQLVINNVHASDVGGYSVTITNSLGSTNSQPATLTITPRTFHHVAATYDRTSGLGVLYFDGIIVTQRNLGSFTPRTTGNFYFGTRPSGTGSPARFRGVMDEAGLFKRALSQAEIVSLYNTPGGAKPVNGLIGHWPFDGNGTELSAGRNATMSSAPAFVSSVSAQAMYFDGVDDQGVVPASAALNLGTNANAGVTMECWIGADVTNALQTLMGWNSGAGTVGVNFGINANGTLFANFIDSGGASHAFNSPTNPFSQVYAPTVVTSPPDVTIPLGQPMALIPGVAGSLPMQFQWFREGNAIPNATNLAYAVGATGTNDAGAYKLAVTNSAGYAFSLATSVAVTSQAPDLATYPTNWVVLDGTDLSLVMNVSGGPPPGVQWMHDGTAIPGETNGTLFLQDVWPPDAGMYQLVATNAVGAITSAPISLVVLTTNNLARVVDAPWLAWQSGESLPWLPVADVTHDGRDAARSGAIADGTNSWLQTTVTGPGDLQFWWKVSSEAGFDRLRLLTNGVEFARISGEVDWEQRTVALPAGTHSLRWQYEKDPSSALGQDRGWLDEVLFTPATGTVPSLLSLRKIRQGQFRFILNSEASGRFNVLRSTDLINWPPLLGLTNSTGEFYFATPISNAPDGAYFRTLRLP